MKQRLIIQPANDHVMQWVRLLRLYVDKRQSDAGRNGKAIPRTTNADIQQLVKYWHGQYLHELISNSRALDKDLASRKRWSESKRTIDRHLAGATPGAVYPANDWFWQQATRRLAIYLESRKAVPTRAELFIDSVDETVSEQLAAAKQAVSDATEQARKGAWSAVKTGAIVLGGLTGAAILIPRIIRAFKD